MCITPENEQVSASDISRAVAKLSLVRINQLEAKVESLRKQLEEANVLNLSKGLKNCILKGDIELLNDEITALRSSRDADIERAIRLTLAEVSRRMLDPAGNKDRLEPIADAVIAQVKEQGK